MYVHGYCKYLVYKNIVSEENFQPPLIQTTKNETTGE